MNNKKKLKVFSAVTIVLILLICAYRMTVVHKRITQSPYPEEANGKRVVNIWLRDNYYTLDLIDRIHKFNDENKTYYIYVRHFGDDYYNMLRIALITGNKPDVFRLGFFDSLKDDSIYSLDKAGFNYKDLDQNTVFKYHGVPMGVNISGNIPYFMVNTDVLKSCGLPQRSPKTWDEVISFARAIKKKYPNMTPFEFPCTNYYDMKISFGETSIVRGETYPSFWDYKKGKYSFDQVKNLFKIYNQMYKENLLAGNYNIISRNRVIDDFTYGRAAMVLTNYDDFRFEDDKGRFKFKYIMTNYPTFDGKQSEQYYIDEINTFVINSNSADVKSASETFRMLNDICLKDKSTGIFNYNKTVPIGGEKLKYPELDPTDDLNFNQRIVANIFIDAVKGDVTPDDAANQLDDFFTDYCGKAKEINSTYFDNYVYKEK